MNFFLRIEYFGWIIIGINKSKKLFVWWFMKYELIFFEWWKYPSFWGNSSQKDFFLSVIETWFWWSFWVFWKFCKAKKILGENWTKKIQVFSHWRGIKKIHRGPNFLQRKDLINSEKSFFINFLFEKNFYLWFLFSFFFFLNFLPNFFSDHLSKILSKKNFFSFSGPLFSIVQPRKISKEEIFLQKISNFVNDEFFNSKKVEKNFAVWSMVFLKI